MVPDSTYTIEIQEASGKQVVGTTTKTEVTIPAAETFTDFGFSKGYATTWLRPTKEEWTVNDLAGTGRDTFSPTDSIAFACESIATPRDSDETIRVLLVVRDADGNVVDYYTGEDVWNDMWYRKTYVGELSRTPQEPGEYKLEIYFNGKLVDVGKPIDFTITEE